MLNINIVSGSIPCPHDVLAARGVAVVVAAVGAVVPSVVGIPPVHCCSCSPSSLSWLEVVHCRCLRPENWRWTWTDWISPGPCPASPRRPRTGTLSWGRGSGSYRTRQVWGKVPP